MSDAVIIALISGVVALASLFMTLMINNKQAKLTTSQENLHRQINSRMDELLRLTRESGKSEGKAEQKAEGETKTNPNY